MHRYFYRFLTTLVLITSLIYSNANACSSFQLESKNALIGKSYDWSFGDGYVIYNPPELEKFSLALSADQKKIEWTSQYASVTYNQYGLDFPNGGLNDKGLTVEVLWLDGSVFPPKDEKPAFNELQWIQYALDTQSTTKGVVDTLKNIRIEPIYAKVHYFVCDIENDCVTIEFVDGKGVIGKYDKYEYDVITNSTHSDSTKYLGLFKNFGGTQDINWITYYSLDRFVRINELLRVYNQTKDAPFTYAFKTLDSVKRTYVPVGSYTQWQIVHDKTKLETYFKTTFGNLKVGAVDLKQFPAYCGDRYYFDLHDSARGQLNANFKPLTLEANYKLVKTTLKKVMPAAPEEMVKAISGAPYKFTCLEK